MRIFYEFECELDEFGFFVEFYARKSGANHQLYRNQNIYVLMIDDIEQKVVEFNDKHLIYVPYFLFLRGFLVHESMDLSGFERVDVVSVAHKRPTPIYHATRANECGVSSSDIMDYRARLLGGDKVCIDGYTLWLNGDERGTERDTERGASKCVVVADMDVLKSAFMVSKHHQIHLNSYENPYIKLLTNPDYAAKNNMDKAYFVGFAPSIDIYHLVMSMGGIVYISSEKIFKIISLQDDFVMLNNPWRAQSKNSEKISAKYIISDSAKCARLPRSLDELRELFNLQEISSRLLANYEREFGFSGDYPVVCDDLRDLFRLLGWILGCDVMDEFARKYQSKAPRIDFRLLDGKIDAKPTISSVMSFLLAGVDAWLICCGVVESFVYFLDKRRDELAQLWVQGELFECERFLQCLDTISQKRVAYVPPTNEI